MKVFVLGTGRCGTLTFVKACQHITNYSVGHESRSNTVGADRLRYRENHIEADNRLVWFLGGIEEKYGKEAFYVHLLRDAEDVAESFNHRWAYKSSIIHSFGYGILLARRKWSDHDKLDVCRHYVQTVTENVDAFLRDKPDKMVMQLETAKEQFQEFWDRIGAKGDLKAACGEWDMLHNRSPNNSNEFAALRRAGRPLKQSIVRCAHLIRQTVWPLAKRRWSTGEPRMHVSEAKPATLCRP